MEFQTLDNPTTMATGGAGQDIPTRVSGDKWCTSRERSADSDADNVTLAIDLRTSWTNASVVFREISNEPAPPSLNELTLWSDPDGISFYVWSGEVSHMGGVYDLGGVPENLLWKFTGDKAGGGIWTNSSRPPSSKLRNPIHRPGTFSCAATLGDTVYHIGGLVWAKTDPDVYDIDAYNLDTIISYNTTSGNWRNDLSSQIGSSGKIRGARTGEVSASGLDGRPLMIVIGGYDPWLSGSNWNPKGNALTYVSFDNVTIYDPYIDKWYAQRASGDIPRPRDMFCAVTVRGHNGTYEM